MEALGAFIRSQRQPAQLSLRQLARLTSLSNPYLSQVERGMISHPCGCSSSLPALIAVYDSMLGTGRGYADQ
jgi:transcriptional regulator with XRE-family HTH domain